MTFKFSTFAKRIVTASLLGVFMGIICTFLASSSNPDIWGSALMTSIIFNRFLIGFVIGIAGLIKHHPCFGFLIPPYFRGAFLGALVSLDSAIGVLIVPEISTASTDMTVTSIFFATLIAGIIYGIIIDVVVSKMFRDGLGLLDCPTKEALK